MKNIYATLACLLVWTGVYAQTTVTINTGATLTADYSAGPIYRSSAASSYDFSQFAYLYKASELGFLGAGATINKLAWNKTNAFGTTGAGKFKIYMKNSSTTAYTTATAFSTLINGASLVYDNASQTIPATTGWVEFNFTTPFTYSGGAIEIIVDWDISSVSGNPTGGAFNWEKTTVSSSILGYANFAAITANLDPSSNSITSMANSRPTLQLTYTPGASCSGTPAPGTTVSTMADVCPGYQFKLSVTGSTSGVAGLTYLWQTSSNGTLWTDVPTETNTEYTTTQTASTYYRRKIICGGTDSDFSTAVYVPMTGAANLPYTENFNGITPPVLPNCVTIENTNADASKWATFAGNGTTLPTNMIRYSYSGTLAADDWFFTKALNLTAGTQYRLQFKYKGSDGPTYIEKLEVKYGTGASSADMISSAIFTNNNINSKLADAFSDGDEVFTVPVSGVYYLGFHCFSDLDQAYLYVDDLSVTTAPACNKPSAVTVSAITTNSATIDWAASPSASSGYQIVVQTSLTPPASGTDVTSGLTFPAGGLAPATVYYVFVRSNCGGGVYSDWRSGTTFTTGCSTLPVPYTQTFDAVATPSLPICFSGVDANADANTWATSTSSTYLIGGTASIVYLYNDDGVTAADDWFFLPALDVTAGGFFLF